MNKLLSKVIIAGVIIIFTLCSCNTTSDPSSQINRENGNTSAVQTESEKGVDIENLQKNEYRITELPGKITVADTYNVYSTDNDFTEEMCQKQGCSYDQTQQYIELQKELAGIDMFIIPKNSHMIFNDFQSLGKLK